MSGQRTREERYSLSPLGAGSFFLVYSVLLRAANYRSTKSRRASYPPWLRQFHASDKKLSDAQKNATTSSDKNRAHNAQLHPGIAMLVAARQPLMPCTLEFMTWASAAVLDGCRAAHLRPNPVPVV
jgi:hypothetical protein